MFSTLFTWSKNNAFHCTHQSARFLWSLCVSALPVSTPNPSVCEVCDHTCSPRRFKHPCCLQRRAHTISLHVGSLPPGTEHRDFLKKNERYILQWLITVGEFSVNYDRGTSKQCLITILWPTCHSWGILWYLPPTVADETVRWWLTHVYAYLCPFYPAGLDPSFRLG